MQKLFRNFGGNREAPGTPAGEMTARLAEIFQQLAEEVNDKLPEELRIKLRGADDGGRFMVYSPFWAISVRGKNRTVEVFFFATAEINNLQSAEVASTLKLRLDRPAEANQWTTNGMALSEDEITTILRSMFKDLITKSKGDYELIPEALRMPLGPDGQSLAGSVRDLINQKHLLTQKIINQQEQLQSTWARDIHDAIIGNVMAVKRAIASDKPLDRKAIEGMLDEINEQLRNICYELAPRDLKDCGLRVVFEGLIEQLEERIEAECMLDFPEEIPSLPDEVQLHVFRIAQECFNNIAKHSDANHVWLRVLKDGDKLTMSVEDDGKGFDIATGGTGMGSSTLRERTALINEFYPAGITIDSTPGEGTKVKLKIDLGPTATGGSKA